MMTITTTNSIEGHRITAYRGIVVGEVITGANVVRDIFAGITDTNDGRSGAGEPNLQDTRDTAMLNLQQKAALLVGNAFVGIDLGNEVVGQPMLMVSAFGTALTVKRT